MWESLSVWVAFAVSTKYNLIEKNTYRIGCPVRVEKTNTTIKNINSILLNVPQVYLTLLKKLSSLTN